MKRTMDNMLSSNNTTPSHTTMHNAEEQYYYGRQVVSASNASVGNDLIVDWPQCIIDSTADEAATRRYPRKKHRRVTNKSTKTKRSVRFSDMSSMQVYTPDNPPSYYYTAKDRKRFSKDALLDAVCIKTHLLMLSRSSPPREEEEMFMTMMDIFEPEDIVGIEQFVFCNDWKKYSSAKIRQDHARAVLCAQQALIRVDEGEEETVSLEDRAKKLCDFASYRSSRSIEEAKSRATL